MLMQANGSLPVIPLYFPVPPVMTWVPQSIFGCDLSRSRVSKVEKILSPSRSASTQAPSIYFLSPKLTFSAAQRADISDKFGQLSRVGVKLGSIKVLDFCDRMMCQRKAGARFLGTSVVAK